MTRVPPADVVPAAVPNRLGGQDVSAQLGGSLDKRDPHDGRVLWSLARSTAADIDRAVTIGQTAQPTWAATPPVERGRILHAVCNRLESELQTVAAVVAAETGKSPREAAAEVGAAVACGRFFAGEGQRLYGRTTTSGSVNRYAMTIRQPVGVAGLIIAANTPIANVAWKVFPALVCGNAAVLKAAEDAPATAWLFARIAEDAGLPPGVLSVVQGLGREAGAPLVADPRVGVVSFTGSTPVGREIATVAGERLAKVSLELGGKNPFVVCEDADLTNAVEWAVASAFSNAGQRCAAGSRIIVVEGVYDAFLQLLLERVRALRLGPTDDDDLGPVINERAVQRILGAVSGAVGAGATILCGGYRLEDPEHRDGYYVAPTLACDVPRDEALVCSELFGPAAVITKVADYAAALAEANASTFGLTASIHTRDWNRALHFLMNVRSGVAVVNAGTHGSEPHMPFGGVGESGNGSREPGTEALDIYSDLKDLYLTMTPGSS